MNPPIPSTIDLAEHVLAVADDSYLTGHPEWEALVNEAKALKDGVAPERVVANPPAGVARDIDLVNGADLTEADFTRLILEKVSSFGIPGARLTLYMSEAFKGEVGFFLSHDKADGLCSGDTFAASIASLRSKIKTPGERAAELRAQADKLEQEAAALEGTATDGSPV